MTKREARKALRAWAEKNIAKDVRAIRHVHPRAYVITRSAGCLVVSVPMVDAEPQIQSMVDRTTTNFIRTFDESLQAGDWCMTGYASTDYAGTPFAIRLDPPPTRADKSRG